MVTLYAVKGMRGINRCGMCNRFMSYENCDEYTNFGNSSDTEPPDPILICAKCSKEEEDKLVTSGRIGWTPWRPARFHQRAAERLGWRFATPRMAAWGAYCDPSKPLPDGWGWEKEAG